MRREGSSQQPAPTTRHVKEVILDHPTQSSCQMNSQRAPPDKTRRGTTALSPAQLVDPQNCEQM